MDKIFKTSIFKDRVLVNMNDYLKSLNFNFVRFVDDVNIFGGNTVAIEYKNEIRQISIYYSPDIGDKHSEFVLIHIHKIPNGVVSVSRLLEKKGLYFESNLYKEGKDFESMVDDYCSYLIFVFDTYLKMILSGKDWVDISIDWYDYK